MSAQPTIPLMIDYADLAIGLCANDNAKGVLWGKRLTAPSSPITQSIVNDALRWAYEGGAVSATEQRQMANYLWWLINPYGLAAEYIISNTSGGGSVVPTPSTRPLPLDFIVSSTSAVPTGSTGISIPAYAGWNLNFSRGGIEQNTTDVGDGSSFYSWDRNTAIFSCSPAAQAGELFRLSPI